MFRLLFSHDLEAFKQVLGAERYDAVIDAQGLLKSAFLITRFTDGPKHGFDRQSAKESMASSVYDVKHSIARPKHAISRTRELFAKALAAEGFPTFLGFIKPLYWLPAFQNNIAIGRHGFPFKKNRCLL